MDKKLVRARTCFYNISYHIVWTVKYRHKVLNPQIQERLKVIVCQIASEKEFIVNLIEVGENNYVHVFVSAHPKISISYIVKMLKGITGRKLMYEFPEIKNQLWKGELWNPSYYVETIGSVSEENIKKYIENQTRKEGAYNETK